MFKFFKKKELKCACNASKLSSAPKSFEGEITSIKVLGTGCKSCNELNENCKSALKELGLGLEVEYIKDISVIASYGVLSVPALVVNEAVLSAGRALSKSEIKELLSKA
ncbi:thioredoxin family protein [Campylobacter magnus]|uniref:thioredoxin family protein n=1 Tax=Campylobacter magnus TaxID=3026462 RepID=UPI0026E05321|nr:thioredoxin family protein [Campylobacter magnus]MDO2407107.1 thioredoxin family protein [Campylobacter magnus]